MAHPTATSTLTVSAKIIAADALPLQCVLPKTQCLLQNLLITLTTLLKKKIARKISRNHTVYLELERLQIVIINQ